MKIITAALREHKLTDEWLKRSLIGIRTDGASVMSGLNRGLAKLIADKYGSQVDFFHCMDHWLELSIDDALKSVTATNHFQAFISSLYSLCTASH